MMISNASAATADAAESGVWKYLYTEDMLAEEEKRRVEKVREM